MKQSPLKKIGKQGKINQKANQNLKEVYKDRAYRCEIGLEGCLGSMYLGVAHRHKRVWYYSQPDLLSSLEQTVLACTNCHNRIENNKELTEEVFLRLRGEE